MSKTSNSTVQNGLVLMGGGARAAYQVGVLRAIYDMGKFKENPFGVITGISAGAINGAWIASHARDFDRGTSTLMAMWKNLEIDKIYKTGMLSLLGMSAHWLKDLGFGSWFGKSKMTNILDAEPLRELLDKNLSFEEMHKCIQDGLVRGVGVIATNYHTGTSVTFFEGSDDIKTWSRGSRIGIRESIRLDHVLASSAIPVFFKPVQLKSGFYGDGGIRLSSPLSSAIHMGANRILAIGIDHRATTVPIDGKEKNNAISIGDIVGTLLNSMFFGSLEDDVERLHRINRTVSVVDPTKIAAIGDSDQLKSIRLLAIRPSVDLGTLASDQFTKFPMALRHFLKGLGVSDEKGWDLLSYLAFNHAYTTLLCDLGYSDALDLKDEILKFFEDENHDEKK